MNGTQSHAEKKKANVKKLLYDSSYVTFLKLQSYGDGKQARGCQGLECREGMALKGWHGRWGEEVLQVMEQFCVLAGW